MSFLERETMLFRMLVSDFQNIHRETRGSIAYETLTNVYQTARSHIQKIKVPMFVAVTITQLLKQHRTDILLICCKSLSADRHKN
jgi:hypothetical protein